VRRAIWCLATAALILGCGEERAPDPPSTLPESSNPGVRELDGPAAAELRAAFAKNQVSARERYTLVRWRMRTTDHAVLGAGFMVATAEHLGRVGVEMRSRDELAKLKPGAPAVIEAEVEEFNPNAELGVTFMDGVVVPDEPDPAK
jgi:hypothetical protein